MSNHDRILAWLSLALDYARKSGEDRPKLLARIANFYSRFDPAGRFQEVADDLESTMISRPNLVVRIKVLYELSLDYSAIECFPKANRLIENARSLLLEVIEGRDRDHLSVGIAGAARRAGNHALADQLQAEPPLLSASSERLWEQVGGRATDTERADQIVLEGLDRGIQECRRLSADNSLALLRKELPRLAADLENFRPSAPRHNEQRFRLVDRVVDLLLDQDFEGLAAAFVDDVRPCSYAALRMAERFAISSMPDEYDCRCGGRVLVFAA